MKTIKPGRDTVLPRNSETLYMCPKFSGWLKVLKLRILLRVEGSMRYALKKMNHVTEKRNSGSNLVALHQGDQYN